MSAAIRPIAAVLRRARHVPVTQRIARRWQTTAAKPVTYDEMLELMEAEYPDPKKPRSKSPRNLDRSKPPPRQRGVQTQQDQANTADEPHTAYQPVTASQSAADSSDITPGTIDREDTRSRPKYKSPKTTLPRPPKKTAPDEHKPRRIPPPVYKTAADEVTNRPVPEKTTLRNSRQSSDTSEQPQAPGPQEALETLEPLESAPKQSLIPVAEPNVDSANTRTEQASSTKKSKTRTKQSSVAAGEPRNPSTQSVPPAQKKHEVSLTDVRLNHLEALRIKRPGVHDDAGLIFDNIFLRDSCTCDQCINTSTRQKRFETADIPSNIRVNSLRSAGRDVVISWKHDVPGFGPDHETRLPYNWLKRTPLLPVTHAYMGGRAAWTDRHLKARIVDFDYNEYMSDDKVLFQLLRQLQTYGVAFIKNLPEAESSVVQTANRIGPLKNTFYGETWDVRSVSNAKNVAYTDVHLGFHMDLLYMQQPPRLQLLHCLRASEQGGISLFSDAYRVADQLYKMDQAAFRALLETPVNFHYDNDSHHYFRSRCTFQLREDITKLPENAEMVWNYLEAVNWAPPFQAPFNHTQGDVVFAKSMRAWHEAAQTFRDLTEINSNVYKRQMAPGECVIFDNRRVLHARTAFAGGERWLRGAYLDDDPYLSKMRVLERSFGTIRTPAASM